MLLFFTKHITAILLHRFFSMNFHLNYNKINQYITILLRKKIFNFGTKFNF